MQDEVELLVDEPADIRQASQHGKGVVVFRVVGAGRVEGAGHGQSL
jgi:hypothetical protein